MGNVFLSKNIADMEQYIPRHPSIKSHPKIKKTTIFFLPKDISVGVAL